MGDRESTSLGMVERVDKLIKGEGLDRGSRPPVVFTYHVVPPKKEPIVDEEYIENIAPNLCALLGVQVAGKLIMKTEGGVPALGHMNVFGIQHIGASAALKTPYKVGHLRETDLYQATPPPWRMIFARHLSFKCVSAACADYMKTHPTGDLGKAFRRRLLRLIHKWKQG